MRRLLLRPQTPVIAPPQRPDLAPWRPALRRLPGRRRARNPQAGERERRSLAVAAPSACLLRAISQPEPRGRRHRLEEEPAPRRPGAARLVRRREARPESLGAAAERGELPHRPRNPPQEGAVTESPGRSLGRSQSRYHSLKRPKKNYFP